MSTAKSIICFFSEHNLPKPSLALPLRPLHMGVTPRGDTGERREENFFLSPHTPHPPRLIDKVILRKNKADCFAVATGDPSSARARANNNRKTASIPGLNRSGPFSHRVSRRFATHLFLINWMVKDNILVTAKIYFQFYYNFVNVLVIWGTFVVRNLRSYNSFLVFIHASIL